MNPVTYLPKAMKPNGSEAVSDLGAKLLSYSAHVESFTSPLAVLRGLHEITSPALNLNVLLAMRFPRQVCDWEAMRPGTNVFLHESAPSGWWEEWLSRARYQNPVIYFMGRMSLAPYTWSEMLHVLAPVGADRWGIELGLKYRLRDGFVCPIGGRWLVMFWSSRMLTNIITEPLRIMIFAAASFAAMRLDQLIETEAETGGSYTPLTPRELAVIRLLSWGKSLREIAADLRLGEETVRTHLKKAKKKLGVRTQTYAVAKAMRQHLIV